MKRNRIMKRDRITKKDRAIRETEWHKGKKRGKQNEKRQNDIKTK